MLFYRFFKRSLLCLFINERFILWYLSILSAFCVLGTVPVSLFLQVFIENLLSSGTELGAGDRVEGTAK